MAAEVRAVDADIPMGMTQVEDSEHKVLFVRDEHGLRAFQAKCPHYGAPLAKGEICGRTLYCPWHKAAFDIGDGALVHPPALKGLDQYPVHTEGEKVVATLEPMARGKPAPHQHDERTFVIVGTGAAAVAAAITLRNQGFGGRLVMVAERPPSPTTARNCPRISWPRTPIHRRCCWRRTSTQPSPPSSSPERPRRSMSRPARSCSPMAPCSNPTPLLIATGSRAVVPRSPAATSAMSLPYARWPTPRRSAPPPRRRRRWWSSAAASSGWRRRPS